MGDGLGATGSRKDQQRQRKKHPIRFMKNLRRKSPNEDQQEPDIPRKCPEIRDFQQAPPGFLTHFWSGG
jgi:hypothetical protein